ncbi:leucine-rich single-pass membrane protein 2 [Eudromia elegans]
MARPRTPRAQLRTSAAALRHSPRWPRGCGSQDGTEPAPLTPDSAGRTDGTTAAEPGDGGSEPGDISLHPVESISDLHWASGGHKGAEGNGPAQPSTLRGPHAHPASHPTPRQPPLPLLRPVPATTACPCFGPCHPLFLALLGVLALASLVLATLAIYLSVLQSQSVRVLLRWLESQEEAVRQLRASSAQLWARLNGSEASGHR